MDRHVMEAMGKAKVIVEDGKVVYVGEPEVEYCPLFFKHRGIVKITPEIVKSNVQFRIEDFGMCSPSRKMRMRDFLSFGVSELLGMLVSKRVLDSAVIVSDGAGTVILSDPELIQGIGGRVSGILETSPIPPIIETIGSERVLDPRTASIDQVAGVEKAFRLGFRKVGVTVSKPEDAREIRQRYGARAVIFAVHSTGVSERGADLLFDNADIVTACASRWVRELAKKRSLLQVGNKVPVYAASPLGEVILRMRLEDLEKGSHPPAEKEDPPRPLV